MPVGSRAADYELAKPRSNTEGLISALCDKDLGWPAEEGGKFWFQMGNDLTEKFDQVA